MLGHPVDTSNVKGLSKKLGELAKENELASSLIEALREEGVDPVKALTGTLSLTDEGSADGGEVGATSAEGEEEGEEEEEEDETTDEDSEESDDSEEEESDESEDSSERRRRKRREKRKKEKEERLSQSQKQEMVSVKFVHTGTARRRELPVDQVRE